IIPHRQTHGLSKTDVIIAVAYNNGCEKKIALSCKQSYVPKMAFAEFDVNTICREVGITDERLKTLMLKHQTDKSAKYFTTEEKAELRKLLEPIREYFVRWVITGSPEKNPSDIVYPTVIVKFKLKKPANRFDIKVNNGDLSLTSFGAVTVEDYIHSIIYDKKGNVKNGGFGTGLAWTYATGSGGFKIQFKA
ncbi:MAG: MspI family type II restriction endonuclease, partial [Eubacterium sp.]|nr:MspI family type II restriction endonuclease [Eubacterium sp.]